ncbi:cytoplasmic dynein 2 intermediate chain 1-like [Patiria miniata]|uniref:WD repeat-containing protein 60 n=1 Tax=Patiria miniata TaxID=46514 RepID=A0A913ZAC6_PATMI|nr:cytoplasmic dynein 2 intermediate chain 1-like [Patiria miniata]
MMSFTGKQRPHAQRYSGNMPHHHQALACESQKSKEDTWKADELERSIKNAMDDSEKRHKHAKSRKKDKDDRRKEGAREKHLKYNQPQKAPEKGHRSVDYDEARSRNRDDINHSEADRLNQTEDKGKRSKKDDFIKKEREKEKRRQIEDDGDNGIQVTHSWTTAGNDGYEDDFEEYEDDFEELPSNSEFEDNQLDLTEVEALRIAMKKENEATSRYSSDVVLPKSKSSASNMSARGGLRQTFINFSAAKQRHVHSKASQKTMQRGRELMNLIELDVSTCTLFEMPPVKVYEVYIKSYGRSDTKQAFVQCQDAVFDRDIQTEPVEMRDIWIQHPSEGTSTFSVCAEDNRVNKEDIGLVKVNSLRLSMFLEKAVQVMSAILEEDISCDRKSNLQNNQCKIPFSEGYTRLYSHLSILKGRYATHAQFHPVQSNLLLTVYSRPKVYDTWNSAQSIICVWNINNSSQPYRILSCRSEVTSCCFSPIKSTFVFAGTDEGAIVAWDLREPSSMHQSMHKDDGQLPLRVPTYSTYGASRDDNHQSPIVKVQPVIITEDSHWVPIPTTDPVLSSEDINGPSFQLVSLDEQGVINFWVVLDLGTTDSGGSETDLGLVPSGKLKLLKSSSVVLENQIRDMPPAQRAKNMKFSLKDPTQFFIATDSGCILHGSRHGDRVSPRRYRKQTDSPGEVIHLDFSPFGLPCFLAGSSDGSICLYGLTQEAPLFTWNNSTSNMPIVSMMWSRSRPSVFYVADVTSKVYVWELLTSQEGPVDIEHFTDGR